MTDMEAKKGVELTAEERAGLLRIVSAEPPHSQRAQALLAVSEGEDLEGAGAIAGLSANQVRYWLGRFGTRRLSVFPEELLADPDVEEELQQEPPLLEAPEEAMLLDAPQEAAMLEAPDVAAELPESFEGALAAPVAAAGATAAGAAAAAESKKKKNKGGKEDKKSKSGKRKKKKSGSKKKKSKKEKKAKKDKKGKKNKKGKKKKKKKKK